MTDILACSNCARPYPVGDLPYQCPVCGGVYDCSRALAFDPSDLNPDLPGIWRYRGAFALPAEAPVVSLGEGRTPLVWSEVSGREVAFKLDYLNPTGSFKDRGTAPLVSWLAANAVTEAVEDSSGNAGASFAAYAARAGIRARVFVPDYAAGPKRAQIAAYGAEVVRILGPRSNAAEAVQRAAQDGSVYASHAYLPLGLPGFATCAYECVEQLGQAPGAVVVPVGQGSLLLGMARGFAALRAAGEISRLPVWIGVQAHACAPLWAVFTGGGAGLGWVSEGQTVAEGIRIRHPLRGDAVLRAVEESRGRFVTVQEADILAGRVALARRGLLVEPTSAVVWQGLQEVLEELPDPVVVVLTGSGYKSLD